MGGRFQGFGFWAFGFRGLGFSGLRLRGLALKCTAIDGVLKGCYGDLLWGCYKVVSGLLERALSDSVALCGVRQSRL